MSKATRSAAALATVAISAFGVVSLPAAVAAPAPSGLVAADLASPSLINPTAPETLHIQKYLGAPTGQPANGTQQSVTGLPALSGVVFDVYTVNGVDLTTNEGWAAAKALQSHTISQAEIDAKAIVINGTTYTLTLAKSVTTGSDGSATYTQNSPSLVLVNENLKSSTNIVNTATGATVAAGTITAAAPYFATLPMTNPDGNAWMYDVYTYPKNTSDGITKTVTDKQTVSTDMGTVETSNAVTTITYGIDGTITAGLTGTQMGTYVITDQLPQGTEYVKATVTVGGQTLVEGVDYTISAPAGDAPKVVITMTAAGLDKLAAAKKADPAAGVHVDIVAKVTTPGDILENTAYIVPNQSWLDQHPGSTGTPSNTVESKYGKLALTKTDAADGTTLAGAKFDLYSGLATSFPASTGDCSSIVKSDTNRIMTGLTTDSTGKLTVTGLQASDFYNNTQVSTGGQYIVYCLVETQAPTGYNLSAQPWAFSIKAADITTTTVTPTALTVTDEKTNLANNLPLTGGAGAASLGMAGLVIVGGTLAARGMSRRRDEDEVDELA